MNIFAKVIQTNNNNIKNEIIKTFSLDLKEKIDDLEIYSKLIDEANIVLIFGENIKNIISYATKNFEVIQFFHLWTALSLDDLDTLEWDVMIPNTFINKDNEALFLEYLIDKNYDLKNFWLLLNWICLTLENDIKDENELEEIIQNYSAEIFDKESFFILEELEKNQLIDKSCIIKIVWNNDDFTRNWVQILELMI